MCDILGSHTSNKAEGFICIGKDGEGLITIGKINGASSSNMNVTEFTAKESLHHKPYNITGEFKKPYDIRRPTTITWSNGTIYSKVPAFYAVEYASHSRTDYFMQSRTHAATHSCSYTLTKPLSDSVTHSRSHSLM